MSDLEEITRRLISLAMERALRNALRDAVGELPDEVLDDIYSRIYRPVMVAAARMLGGALRQYLNKTSAK